MRRLLPLPFAVLVGCSDGLFRPAEELLDIEIERQSVSEATLLAGESLALSVRSRGGPDGARTRWLSTDPAVATVAEDGVVRGVSFGSANVVATRGQLEDTLHLSVLDGVPPDGFCGSGGLVLQRGESITSTAGAIADLCIRGSDRSQIYVAVPFHAAQAGSGLRVEIAAEGVGDGTFDRDPSAPGFQRIPQSRSDLAGEAGEPRAIPSRQFDRALRERERRDLAPLVGVASGRSTDQPSLPALSTAPTPGSTLILNVNPLRTCSDPWHREVRVAAVSERAVILHDQVNPAGGFTDAEYRQFAKLFDELVYPTVVENFGEPTDIDGNGRILIVFTSAVNQMTGPEETEYVAGFFYARDLFPKSRTPPLGSCAASNSAELIYMMTPDPGGAIHRNVRPKRFVAERTPSVLGHELQHLVSASRRLRVVGTGDWNEEFWLNEGLSHIAEELLFYAATGAPRQREITATFVRGGYREAFDLYHWANLGRYDKYLRNPSEISPFLGGDLETRGASWSFLRYVADRMNGDEAALWRRLVDSPAAGYANLASAMGASPLTWMHDWAVSLYTDDLIAVPDRFRQPSWNFRSILPTLATGAGVYPLKVHPMVFNSPSYSGTLVPGGAAVIRFSIPAHGSVRLRTTSGGRPAPDDLRLTLVRTF